MKRVIFVGWLSCFSLSLGVLILIASTVKAHTLDMPSAQFQWQGGYYAVTLKLDWLTYLERHLEHHLEQSLKQREYSLKQGKLSLLSDSELRGLLEKTQRSFQEKTYLLLGDQRHSMESIVFPSVVEVREFAQKQLAFQVLHKNTVVHRDEYPFLRLHMKGDIKGDRKAMKKSLGISFPEEIGPVLVTFSEPRSQMQRPGTLAKWMPRK